MTDDALDTPSNKPLGPSFLTEVRFDSFNLPADVKNGIRDTGYTRCTPIQAEVLPLSLAGRDVAGQAQTGTGKTAAFLVTVFSRLLETAGKEPHRSGAMIVAPTRELAIQIVDEAQMIGRYTGLRIVQVVGGIDYKKQAENLREGSDIIVCTPGRIIDYMKQKVFDPKGIRILVIDEADRLFDLGFTQDMRYILRRLPHYERRQTMLFSATLSYRVMELTYEYMNLPEVVSITPERLTVEGIDQSLIHVGKNEKVSLLLGLLEREAWSRVLIFLNTKAGVEWLTAKLVGNGYPAEGITGDLLQKKRLRLMKDFKKGDIKILLATDVASRGIHVEDISHVINYDLPQDSENYVHRIGRTARAGKTGKAISLACEEYVYHLESLENMLGYKIPIVWPEDDWFKVDTAGRIQPRRKSRTAPSSPKGRKQAVGRRGVRRPGAESAEKASSEKKSNADGNPPRRRRRRKPSGKGAAGTGRDVVAE
jgi:ATP-dependent RNA helicase RhlB